MFKHLRLQNSAFSSETENVLKNEYLEIINDGLFKIR